MPPTLLEKPLTLPCGLTLPSRLVKAAMAEHMSDCRRLPTSQGFENAYSAWANGGWGMILTGNVQVDGRYLGDPHDTAIDHLVSEGDILAAYRNYAQACRKHGTPSVIQINHPGRQSPVGAGTRSWLSKNVAPSAVKLNLGDGLQSRLASSIVFGTPRELSILEIEDVIGRFAYAARIAADTGFDGVEIHAAHGYLLAQFLSPKSNNRDDIYGGSVTKRVRLILDIIKAIRSSVPQNFCIGIKLNSVDHQAASGTDPTSGLDDYAEQIRLIVEEGIDFIEISGGTYENPLMITGGAIGQDQSRKSAAREAFFIEFAQAIREKVPETMLMITGGFRTRRGMEAAFRENACNLVGVGRPAVLNPTLPKDIILNSQIKDEDAVVVAKKIPTPWLMKKLGPRGIGSGTESSWYSNMIQKIHEDHN